MLSAAALVQSSRTRPEPPALPHTTQSSGRRGHCRPISTLTPWGISASERSAGVPLPPLPRLPGVARAHAAEAAPRGQLSRGAQGAGAPVQGGAHTRAAQQRSPSLP